MKKLVAVLAAVWLAAGLTASAQMGDFGVRGGYQRLSDNELGGAFVFGGYFRWDWQRIVMLEAAVLYHEEEIQSGTATNAEIDLELIPIQLSALIYPLQRNRQFSPYVLVGGDLVINREVEKGVSSDSDYDIGWHLGFGLDYTLSGNVFLEGDFRYIWMNTDTDSQTIKDTFKSFDSWAATVGIGFRL